MYNVITLYMYNVITLYMYNVTSNVNAKCNFDRKCKINENNR